MPMGYIKTTISSSTGVVQKYIDTDAEVPSGEPVLEVQGKFKADSFETPTGPLAAGVKTTIVQNLLADASNYHQYTHTAVTSPFFQADGHWSITCAFRIMRTVSLPSTILKVSYPTDNSYWAIKYDYDIGIYLEHSNTTDGTAISKTAQVDVPLGRTIHIGLSHDGDDDTMSLAVAGLTKGSNNNNADVYLDDPGGAAVTLSFGAHADWNSTDNVELIGFSYHKAWLSAADQTYMHTEFLDTGKISVPAVQKALGEYVVYNADTGLTDVNSWVPEESTMTSPVAPDLALTTVGSLDPIVKKEVNFVPGYPAYDASGGTR